MALYCISEHYRTRATAASTERPPIPFTQQIHMQVSAETFFDADQPDLSLAAYHELCFLHRPTAKTLFNISQLHLRKRNLRECTSWLRHALRRDPFLAVAYFQLAAVLVRMGKIGDAFEAYTKCLNVSLRGSSGSAGLGNGDIEYAQIGLRYHLRVDHIKHNQRLCEHWLKLCLIKAPPLMVTDKQMERLDNEARIIGVPYSLIFRLPERIVTARHIKPAETAEWRFRDEARVVAEVPTDSGRMGAWG